MSQNDLHGVNPGCQTCNLCCNQLPLTEPLRASQVICVGLSAKLKSHDNETPLDPRTVSGKIIKAIEDKVGFQFYKTNLVKCAPLNQYGILRYPTSKEVSCCIPHLKGEIAEVNPKIVLLLGQKVSKGIEKHRNIKIPDFPGYQYQAINHNGVKYIAIQHPSYIYVYKRKELQQYIDAVADIICKEITDAE
jgi:DNA polymerase